EIEAALAVPAQPPAAQTAHRLTPDDFVSRFTPDSYATVIARIKDYIAAGDVMQVVPSQRLTAKFEAEPVALYRALRRLNP
ncbi:chorismate-binding protein, partial [Acinetobacter baumannii]